MTALVLVILGIYPGCDGTGPTNRPDEVQERTTDPSQGIVVKASDPARTGPKPCTSQSGSAWTPQARTTRDLSSYGSIGGLVVDQRGTATVAWSDHAGGHWNVRTFDQPSSPGDPQVLPGPPPHDPVPDGARVSAMLPMGDHLGVDGSGSLTAMWLQDLSLRSGENTEYYDLVLSERAPGSAWSPTPYVAGDGYIGNTALAVNASGAAVVAWDRFGGRSPYVAYRPAAGAPWTPAEQLSPPGKWLRDVGIDDSGRAVLLYGTRKETMVVRGTPIAGWSRPQPLPPGARMVAVGAGGEAVVAGSRGAHGGRAYTVSMSPSGAWTAPVRQPGDGLYPDRMVAMDGVGRALYVWWDKPRLMERWRGPGGRWREPCVLAVGIPDPRYFDDVDSHLAMNRRGDALLVWRTEHPTPQLWARYKPAGQAWTDPIKVTVNAARLPGEFRAAIGARGDAAVAWISLNRRQLNVLRMSRAR